MSAVRGDLENLWRRICWQHIDVYKRQAYTFADTTLSGSADWRAYFTPLSEDGKYYTHMAEPVSYTHLDVYKRQV